jgi:26S proteasome regulatory subunit N12
LQLTQLPALPPSLEQTPTAQKELQLARGWLHAPECVFDQSAGTADKRSAACSVGDILEQAVFLSVRLQDEAAFERNYLQLKTYYTDTK